MFVQLVKYALSDNIHIAVGFIKMILYVPILS